MRNSMERLLAAVLKPVHRWPTRDVNRMRGMTGQSWQRSSFLRSLDARHTEIACPCEEPNPMQAVVMSATAGTLPGAMAGRRPPRSSKLMFLLVVSSALRAPAARPLKDPALEQRRSLTGKRPSATAAVASLAEMAFCPFRQQVVNRPFFNNPAATCYAAQDGSYNNPGTEAQPWQKIDKQVAVAGGKGEASTRARAPFGVVTRSTNGVNTPEGGAQPEGYAKWDKPGKGGWMVMSKTTWDVTRAYVSRAGDAAQVSGPFALLSQLSLGMSEAAFCGLLTAALAPVQMMVLTCIAVITLVLGVAFGVLDVFVRRRHRLEFHKALRAMDTSVRYVDCPPGEEGKLLARQLRKRGARITE